MEKITTSLLLALLFVSTLASSQDYPAVKEDGTRVAPVVVDGKKLLEVRGVAAYPADYRAELIKDQIILIANDETIEVESGVTEANNGRMFLKFGEITVATLHEVDAEIEGVPLQMLADATLIRLKSVITEYREARTPERLLHGTLILVGITVLALVLIWICLRLLGWINRLIERRGKGAIDRLEKASHRIIHGGQVWGWMGTLAKGLRALAIIGIILTWASTALGLYPWTRPFAANIFRLILDPLHSMGNGILNAIPDLAFLAVLTLVVRFVLGGTKTFFNRVDRGWIKLQNFDSDWAMPTYRIVRVFIVAFAVIIAYPYIPGSDSEAFKGIGLFMGVILSIGSTSFIANMIAGISLTYRAAYREGDRVQIGDHVGEVIEVRALNTRLRSLKNEEINIPNSLVLNSAVTNYNAYMKKEGLVLHTEVGIGYDTPWRQVEAMLKMAADRTANLDREREPFVLQKSLGDFTVVYELNAYCHDTKHIMRAYSDLHANIQDVFNEFGVQIMSPNYEHDPETAKIVAPDQWYPAPAAPPKPVGDEQKVEQKPPVA